MSFAGVERSRQVVAASVIGTVLICIMGAVLFMGVRLATQVRTSITSLQTASVLQAYPEEMAHQLSTLRDRLEARAYAGQAAADLKGTTALFDARLKQLGTQGSLQSHELDQALLLWQQYGPVLDPVTGFAGQPYTDSDEAGSALSKEGHVYFANVKRAQLFATENSKRLQKQLAAAATSLQASSSEAAARLRGLLFTGVFAALVLALAAAYFQVARARQARVAREAQDQTRDILKTVREGFFLLDADYRIGSVWSDALTRMFSRSDFSGLSFEELLKDLVTPATLTTAMKYIRLLWGDRAHENLMKSINPLSQLEVQVADALGGKETRYLQFDFHRVMGPKGVKQVLCAVVDITSSVLLAKELEAAQQSANAQVDMMLGLMHVDPLQLTSFLDTAEAGLKLINAILKEPARTDGEFRKKLNGLFRELHAIKGEASALNLMSIAQRVHALEDMVAELKKKPELSGNDFLTMVVKLDELLAHARSIREMAGRLTALKDTAPPPASAELEIAAPQPGGTHRSMEAPERRQPAGDELAPTLQGLAERLARESGKRFKLNIAGLEQIPDRYVSTVKDCVIQMLRNSAVHGIEPVEARRAQTKEDVGTVSVEFHKTPGGYELVFEDDGAGMSPENLKAAALRRGIITPAEAAALDTRSTMALIFRPGFSTQDQVSMDAGRGVGMDIVARSVYSIGGKIGVSTNPGRFTRFKIVLPPVTAASTAVA